MPDPNDPDLPMPELHAASAVEGPEDPETTPPEGDPASIPADDDDEAPAEDDDAPAEE